MSSWRVLRIDRDDKSGSVTSPYLRWSQRLWGKKLVLRAINVEEQLAVERNGLRRRFADDTTVYGTGTLAGMNGALAFRQLVHDYWRRWQTSRLFYIAIQAVPDGTKRQKCCRPAW